MLKLINSISHPSRRFQRIFVLSAPAVLVLGVIAYASIPDSNGVIHGCYKTSNGSLRVIDSPAVQCDPKNETPISWNQAGTQGPQGVQGEVGPIGPQGPPGLAPTVLLSLNADGTIARCYNGVSGETTGNCGFNAYRSSDGIYFVEFPFSVRDRPYSIAVDKDYSQFPGGVVLDTNPFRFAPSVERPPIIAVRVWDESSGLIYSADHPVRVIIY
jgi:hypothetical protein